MPAKGYRKYQRPPCGNCGGVIESKYAMEFCSKRCRNTAKAMRSQDNPAWKGTPQERASQMIDKSGDCWLWTGRVDPDGYGRLKIEGKEYKVSRLAYEWAYGHPPSDQFVLH